MNERASQARFTIDRTTNELVEASPIPDGAILTMIGKTEVVKFTPEATRQLVQETNDEIRKSRDDFYAANPHLRGESAYYAWLAQASDY